MIPKLRFNEFRDAWKVTTFNEEVDFYNSKRIPIKEGLRTDGVYPYYGATGIIDYVDNYIFDGEYLLLAEDGANIINRTAPVVYKASGKFWVNNHAHIFKPKNNNSIDFFLQALERINYIPYNTGTAQPKLNIESVKNILLRIPSLEEQRRIASLFNFLDERIKKQQEKVELLKEQKKALMQKIFSRELRFRDEDGKEFPEWEEKKIGEILKIKHGRDQKKVERIDGKYPILGTGGIIGRTDDYLYDRESVLIGRKGTINKPRYMNSPFWTVDTLFYSEIKKTNDAKFIYYVFQTIFWDKYNEASGVPSLSASTIENIKCMFPVKKEQSKISNMLWLLDKKIEKEKEKISDLKERKNGFMQQMFI